MVSLKPMTRAILGKECPKTPPNGSQRCIDYRQHHPGNADKANKIADARSGVATNKTSVTSLWALGEGYWPVRHGQQHLDGDSNETGTAPIFALSSPVTEEDMISRQRRKSLRAMVVARLIRTSRCRLSWGRHVSARRNYANIENVFYLLLNFADTLSKGSYNLDSQSHRQWRADWQWLYERHTQDAR